MNDTLEGIAAVVIVVAAVVAAIGAGFAIIFIAGNHIYAGTVVEYEGTVQAVTRNSFLAPHTSVVLRTYSEADFHFTLYGYHAFDIGAQYGFRMTMRPYVYGLVCWGKIMDPHNIEKLGAEG